MQTENGTGTFGGMSLDDLFQDEPPTGPYEAPPAKVHRRSFADVAAEQEKQQQRVQRGTEELAEFFAASDTKLTKEQQVTQLLEAVENQGGTALVDDLLRQGHTPAAFRDALSQPEGDKRVNPLLRPGVITGAKIVTLTSRGWSALGFPNKREQRPSATRMAHALAPARIAEQLPMMARAWAEHVSLHIETRASGINEWQASITARAWGRINSGAEVDTEGTTGELTRSVPRPDGIIYEEWTEGVPAECLDFWDIKAFAELNEDSRDTYTELTHLVEVETSDKRTNALRAKVARLNKVLDLGGADSVLWVVNDPQTARRVSRAVAAQTDSRRGLDLRHRFIDYELITSGRNGFAVPDGLPVWWLPDRWQRRGFGSR